MLLALNVLCSHEAVRTVFEVALRIFVFVVVTSSIEEIFS